MEIQTACELIDNVVLWPGWKLTPHDNSGRYEGTICVRYDWPTIQLNRKEARERLAAGEEETPETINGDATFRIVVMDIIDPSELYRRLLQKVMVILEHEAREALRIKPTLWAPFHPHKPEGMARWGNQDADMAYGVV